MNAGKYGSHVTILVKMIHKNYFGDYVETHYDKSCNKGFTNMIESQLLDMQRVT